MNFVADESVDQPIVEALRSDGHSVKAVVEISPGIPDDEVLLMAVSTNAVLLTQDKDFGELVYRRGQASSGVLLIRLAGASASRKAELVTRAVDIHGQEFPAAFSVLDSTQLRVRRPTT